MEVESPDVLQTTIALSSTGKMLFCGSKQGHVRSYKFPFHGTFDYVDYVGHCAPITKMRITLNDEFLVTVSDDCSIMIWILEEKDGHSNKMEREVAWADEVLITKTDLEEKVRKQFILT